MKHLTYTDCDECGGLITEGFAYWKWRNFIICSACWDRAPEPTTSPGWCEVSGPFVQES
jgi:hypothetical protein